VVIFKSSSGTLLIAALGVPVKAHGIEVWLSISIHLGKGIQWFRYRDPQDGAEFGLLSCLG